MNSRRNMLVAVAAGAFCFLLSSCKKDEVSAPAQITNTSAVDTKSAYLPQDDDGEYPSVPARLTGSWRLVNIGDMPVAANLADRPWMTITDGLIGWGGCNAITASVVQHGDQISFIDITSTRKYCPATHAQEQSFLTALRTTNSFLRENDVLQLFSDRGVTVRMERIPPTPPTVELPVD